MRITESLWYLDLTFLSVYSVTCTNFPSHFLPLLRGERRFEKPLRREVVRPSFEEGAGPAGPVRKEYTRADSDNWRTLREEQEEEEGEPGTNWRLTGLRRDGMEKPERFVF